MDALRSLTGLLKSIADHCPALETLDVDRNDRITAVSLGVLGHECLKLENVSVRGLELVNEENIPSLELI